MLELLVILVVVVVVVAGGAATLVVRSRRRGAGVLEPPARGGTPRGRLGERGTTQGRTTVPSPAPSTGAGPETDEGSGVAAGPDTVAAPATPPGAGGESGTAGAQAGTAAPAEPAAEPTRLRTRLGRARDLLAGALGGLRGGGRLDASAWDELEEALILADVGLATTTALLVELRAAAAAQKIDSRAGLVDLLGDGLVRILSEGDRSLDRGEGVANVWLFVGVNGVGKTTTIGKVAAGEAKAGRQVVLAAGDTFRAAAAEQLELWAERAGVDLVRGAEGADPGAVVYDAVQRAAARKADLVLADTAGRLHTKVNLMEELKKVRRVADRDPGTVREVLLVIDATTGQNGLVQARQFAEAVGVTGVVLTKLDGTAKGGIAVAIQGELGIPIKLVGVGEGVRDLVPFDPEEFVAALLGSEEGEAA